MSDDDAVRRLRALRADDRWDDRPFRTAARPAARPVPWRPAVGLGLALAAVLGITVLIGQEHERSATTAAAPVAWAPLSPAAPALRPLGETGTGRPMTTQSSLRATLQTVPRLTPGRTADYVVRLTNVAGTAARLSPCPSYTETLARGDGAVLTTERYRLNCAAAGSIAAGASRAFAMRVHVPAAGAARLTWRLDDGTTATKEIP